MSNEKGCQCAFSTLNGHILKSLKPVYLMHKTLQKPTALSDGYYDATI